MGLLAINIGKINSLTPRFVTERPGALEALTLLFADDVKMLARRTQNISLHSSLITARGWSKKWDLPIHFAKCNYLTIEREVPLSSLLSLTSLPPPSLYQN